MINITDQRNCCGCEACVQACPKHCISFDEDAEGFRYPKVDVSLCVECGACEKVCPMLTPYESCKPRQVLAAINPDEKIREESSSGGIFTMLAENVIREGGVVFGVCFDEHWQAVFGHTETADGLAAFRGSKYLQARVGNAFKEAKDYLKDGRKVLFSGTPCQISALRHFLHRDYDNLLCVDFICHGTPSPKVWRMYLDEVTQNAVRAIRDVQFRNKRQGWKRFNFDMTYDADGQHYNISSWHRENHYMRIFLDDVILRPSCYACKAKGGRSHSDLTIADFWGIGQLNPQMDDDRGTSLVLLHSDKGVASFEACHLNPWQAQYDDILRLNPAVERSAKAHPKRGDFFAHLDNAESVTRLIDDTLRLPLYIRVKQIPKRYLKAVLSKLKSVAIGGGKNGILTTSVSVTSECQTSINPLPVRTFQTPTVTALTFRSKHQGWQSYRMNIQIANDTGSLQNPSGC